jgi:hypothetical protein
VIHLAMRSCDDTYMTAGRVKSKKRTVSALCRLQLSVSVLVVYCHLTTTASGNSQKIRDRIRFEFEMVFKWPIFGLSSNQIFKSNRIFYTYCNLVRICRQSQSSEKKGA